MTACPHCGMQLAPPQMRQHEPACPDNPQARERIRQAMEDPDHPGWALSPDAYSVRARQFGAPAKDAIFRRWRKWTIAAADLGLTARGAGAWQCPHCARQFGGGGHLSQHLAACIDNPDIAALIVAAMTHPEHPGMAGTREEYNAARRRNGAPVGEALVRRYGSWQRACAAHGLTPFKPRKENGSVDRGPAVDEHEQMLAEAARIRQTERDYQGGPGCAVRVLPDGRYAWMVR